MSVLKKIPNTRITIPSINNNSPLDGISLGFMNIIIRIMAMTRYRIPAIRIDDIRSITKLTISRIIGIINKILIIKSFLSSSMFSTLFFVFTFELKKKLMVI